MKNVYSVGSTGACAASRLPRLCLFGTSRQQLQEVWAEAEQMSEREGSQPLSLSLSLMTKVARTNDSVDFHYEIRATIFATGL